MRIEKDFAVILRGKEGEKKEEFSYPVYETSAEIVDAYGEAKTVALFNAKVKTEARNKKAIEMAGGADPMITVLNEIKKMRKAGDKEGVKKLLAMLADEPDAS